MKNKFYAIALIITVVLISCKKEKVADNCEYKTINKEMIVTFVDGEFNGEFIISLQPKNSNGDEVYRLDKKQLKSISRNFDLKEFRNKKNKYVMSIREVYKGTCAPFKIMKLTLR